MPEDSEIQGVRANHPTIVRGIQNLHKQGESKEKIAKVIGVPMEIVDKEIRKMDRKS